MTSNFMPIGVQTSDNRGSTVVIIFNKLNTNDLYSYINIIFYAFIIYLIIPCTLFIYLHAN